MYYKKAQPLIKLDIVLEEISSNNALSISEEQREIVSMLNWLLFTVTITGAVIFGVKRQESYRTNNGLVL